MSLVRQLASWLAWCLAPCWKRRKWASYLSAAWGPGQPVRADALTLDFSYSAACKDQTEIDRHWDKLLDGGKR